MCTIPRLRHRRCTKELLVNPRKYLPQNQNKIPHIQKRLMSAMVVMTGGMKPASVAHGVIYLLKP